MSMNLESILRDYAIESGLVDDHDSNPEEITVVTDETVTELEEELQEVADKVSDAKAEVDQVIEASDAIVSVESVIRARVAQLENPEFQSEYTRTVQAMTWGIVQDSMEGYGFPKEMIDGFLADVSYEADEAEGGKEGQAEKDGSKLKAIGSKLWEMVTKAYEAASAFIVRFVDVFKTSIEKNERSAKVLEKVIAGREGEASDKKFKNSSYRKLVVGGKVDPAGAVSALSDTLNSQIKPALVAINKGLSENISALENANSEEKVEKMIDIGLKSLPDDSDVQLPGGYNSTLVRIKTAKMGVVYSIKAGPNVEGETDVPSLDVIKSIPGNMRKLNEVLKSCRDELNTLVTENKKTINRIKKIKGLDAMRKMDADSLLVKGGGIMASAILNSSRKILPTYSKHVLQAGHEMYKFGIAAAGAYPKKGKATESKSTE